MRTPNLGTVSYQPNQVPEEVSALPMFLREELDRIAATIRLLALGHIDPDYAEPPKPRAGDIRYADGTSWNPGSGEGLYRRSLGGAWVFLG